MNCRLCSIFSNYGSLMQSNEILFETDRFVLVPSIGPLNIGHVLIVSKSHTCGLTSMDKKSITELFHFVDFLSKKANPDKILFFEHGSFDNQDAGSCVTHTHIHVMPDYNDFYNVLDSSLKIIHKVFKLSEILKMDFPYIMTLADEEHFRIYEAYNVHSQMMRKAICSKLNIQNWDWKKNDNVKMIDESIKFWKKKLLNT